MPLLVLTADRPPELREVGAGQTIDQVKLYGSAAKWFFEVDDHPASPARMRWLRQLACRAFWTALDGRPGPVHLNFSLREPLVLDEPLGRAGAEVAGGREGGRPWVTRPRVARVEPGAALLDGLARRARGTRRGPCSSPAAPSATRGSARRSPRSPSARALPLLADPLSGARRGPAAIAHYDALLRDPEWAAGARARPRAARRRPARPPSRCASGCTGSTARCRSRSTPSPRGRTRPARSATIVAADPRATLEALAATAAQARRDPRWLDALARAPTARRRARSRSASGRRAQRAARRRRARRPAARPRPTLVVASSMPSATSRRSSPPATRRRVLSNRGANGIDGTVSTAFGVAAAARGPIVLLIGDVALAHDVGGLLAARAAAG